MRLMSRLRNNRTKPAELVLEEERLMLEATELVSAYLIETGVTKADLARRIGKSRSAVSMTLSGDRNMTLRNLAEMAFHLGVRVKLVVEPLSTRPFNADDPESKP